MIFSSLGFAVVLVVFAVRFAVVLASMITVIVITIAISAMAFLGFSDAFSPRFFHSLASFVAFLFAHFVPAISQRVIRAFPMRGAMGASLGLFMSMVCMTFMFFSHGAIGEDGNDA